MSKETIISRIVCDYPLVVANGIAHGGWVDTGQDIPSQWIAYVMVEDVDAATTQAYSWEASTR